MGAGREVLRKKVGGDGPRRQAKGMGGSWTTSGEFWEGGRRRGGIGFCGNSGKGGLCTGRVAFLLFS